MNSSGASMIMADDSVVKLLVALGRSDAKLSIVKADQEPPDVYYVQHGESHRRIVAEPRPRKHLVTTLDCFVASCNRYGAPDRSMIWIGDQGLTLTVDDSSDRRHRVALRFTHHAGFTMVAERKTIALDQRALINLLRNELSGCLDKPADLLSIVRTIRFNAKEDGSSELKTGKESIAHSTLTELYGGAVLPETVELNLPVYVLPTGLTTQRVRCSFDVNLSEQRFSLRPLPGEIEKALEETWIELHEALRVSLKHEWTLLVGREIE